MQSDKASSERFLLSDEVAEVGFAKVSTGIAITVLSQRRKISSKVRICNFDIPLIRKGDSMPSKPRLLRRSQTYLLPVLSQNAGLLESLPPSNILAFHLVKVVRYARLLAQSALYFLQRSPHRSQFHPRQTEKGILRIGF